MLLNLDLPHLHNRSDSNALSYLVVALSTAPPIESAIWGSIARSGSLHAKSQDVGSVSTAKISLRTILDEGIEIASKLAFVWPIDPER